VQEREQVRLGLALAGELAGELGGVGRPRGAGDLAAQLAEAVQQLGAVEPVQLAGVSASCARSRVKGSSTPAKRRLLCAPAGERRPAGRAPASSG
jgi:hypothetical protein